MKHPLKGTASKKKPTDVEPLKRKGWDGPYDPPPVDPVDKPPEYSLLRDPIAVRLEASNALMSLCNGKGWGD